MKKKQLDIDRERVVKVLRQALSPTFLLILLGSFLLWYTSKLSYDYTTEMPLDLRIDGQRYRITAIVTGRGSVLVGQRLSLKGPLHITLDELSTSPSTETEGALTITAASLQNAINGKTRELNITQIVDAPDFVPAPPEEGDDGKTKRATTPLERR